jgi:hypothetical protein
MTLSAGSLIAHLRCVERDDHQSVAAALAAVLAARFGDEFMV